MSLSLADRFEATVDSYGDLPAVQVDDRITTFSQLDARANQVAAWLHATGVTPGDRVGIALWNRLEHLEVLLGAFKAGAIPVNVNCRYTATEIEELLLDCGARLIVHEPTLAHVVADASVGHDWVSVAIGPDYESALRAQDTTRPSVPRSGDDLYLLYTGGSTGSPKGVLWRQEDLFVATMAPSESRRPGSRMLPASPLTHGTAQWTTLSTLISAGTVVFGPLHHLDPVALWDRVADASVSRLVIVGDAFARPLLDALDAEPERWDLSSLVTITSGGARLSLSVQDDLLAHLPHVAMVNSFGASETGGQGSQVRFAGESAHECSGLIRFTPDDNTTVLDTDHQEIRAGSKVVGMLAQRGPVPLGYFQDLERTASTFPILGGVRYSIPGDLAWVDDNGDIVVLGRGRNVINTGGEKVFAEEVEAHLISHPAVADAVVVGVADDRWGERVGALVMLRKGANVDEATLINHCARALARFKLPRYTAFVPSIRRLPTGKLDRSWATGTMATFVTTIQNE